MPTPWLRADVGAEEVRTGLAQIREELDVPGPHPPEVVAEAEQAARSWTRNGRADRTEIPFVTIDPPESKDLDQALHLSRRKGGGYRVHYAIADLAAFLRPGGALDRSVRARGVTWYLPDGRAELHPPVLSEGAASLLPDDDRPAVLWTIELDRDGAVEQTRAERAVVRSRAKQSYAEVQQQLDRGTAEQPLVLLAEVGRLRALQEAERGGTSLELPSQEVERRSGGYALRFDRAVPVEDWNAQISLLTGMEAARLMLEADVGILRTLPPPDEHTLDAIRRSARALHQPWPAFLSYPRFVRSIDAAQPSGAALMTQVARAFRGAGYEAFDGGPPVQPLHAAVAAPYADVTAPLRRLVDRFATECVLHQLEGRGVPAWVREALPELPKAMQQALQRSNAATRAVVDLMEALVLRDHVGEVLPAVVTKRDEGGTVVQITDPAVLTRIEAELEPGATVDLRLAEVDPVARKVHFTLA